MPQGVMHQGGLLLLIFLAFYIIHVVLNSIFKGVLKQIQDDEKYENGPSQEKLNKYPPVNYDPSLYGRKGIGVRSANNIHLDGLDCLHQKVECTIGSSGIANSCSLCLQNSAKCVHYSTSVRVVDKLHNRITTYAKNSSPDRGYCTPLESSSADSTDSVSLNPCHPSTGIRYLMKLNPKSEGYTFICKCKDDNFFTQIVPLMTDCNQPVSCEKTGGKLGSYDWEEEFNPQTVTCVDCPTGMKPGRASGSNYPICVYKTFGELTKEEALQSLPPIPKNLRLLNVGTSEALAPGVKLGFTYPNERDIPDPCSYDPFTGELFSDQQCRLANARMTPGEDRIYYCQTLDIALLAIRTDNDYLQNNGGRYPNACIRILPERIDAAHEHAQIVEYWNVPKEERSHGDSHADDAKKKQFVLPTTGVRLGLDTLLKLHPDLLYPLHLLVKALVHNSDLLWIRSKEPNVNYGAGEMQRVRNIHRNIGDEIFLFAYNASYPANHQGVVLFPYQEYPLMELGTAGMPGTKRFGPVPYLLKNVMLKCPRCENIGSYKNGFSDSRPNEKDLGMLTLADFERMLYQAYVACQSGKDSRVPIIPNHGLTPGVHFRDYVYSTACLLIYSRRKFLRSIWLGDEKDLSTYLTRLPGLPSEKLF